MSGSKKSNSFKDTAIGSFFSRIYLNIKNKSIGNGNGTRRTPQHDTADAGKGSIADTLQRAWASVKGFFINIAHKMSDSQTTKKIMGAVRSFFAMAAVKVKAFFSAAKRFFANTARKLSESNAIKKILGAIGAFFAMIAAKIKHFFSAENLAAMKSRISGFFAKLFGKNEKTAANESGNSANESETDSAETEEHKEPLKREKHKKNIFKALCISVLAAFVLFFRKIKSLAKKAFAGAGKPKAKVDTKNKTADTKAVDSGDNNTNKNNIRRMPQEEPVREIADAEPSKPVARTSKPAVEPSNPTVEPSKPVVEPLKPVEDEDEVHSNETVAVDPVLPIMDIRKLESRSDRKNRTEKDKKSDDDEDEEKHSIWVRDRRPFFLVSIGVSVCRLCLLLVIMAGFAGLGIGLGVARAYIASAPELSVEKIENNDQTSFIYDCNGNLITEYYNLENRSWASYDEIPTMLKYAVVASEDESFFEHNGFNFKRIFASVLSNLSGGSVSGGSTITQQVLKLTLLTSQQTYKRKIQEIYLAYQLEKEYTKEDILEWYMNIMPMGGLLYGVKSASEDYFGKELSELTLRECAVLAGATNAPTYYNPRLCMLSEDDGGYGEKGRLRLYNRANYVLTQMYAVGFISEEEYNDALFDTEDLVSDQLVVNPTSTNYTYEHKYYIEYVLDELVTRLKEANGWEGKTGTEQAYSLLRSGGFKIYTALDVEKQTKVENAVYSYENWPKLLDPSDNISTGGIEQPQCAVMVIDNSTGYIAAVVGGRTEPTIRFGLNRAYQCVLPFGSSIKPLSVYGPALDRGLLGNMVIENIPVPINGWQSTNGFPQNFDKTYCGPMSVSYALYRSMNVPTSRILLGRLTPQVSYSYLRSLNISESVLSMSPSLLALGSTGSYLVEYAAAFATFANGGVYREPLSITKIIDKDGNELFSEENQIYKQVFKKSTVYIITEWLNRAVSQGNKPLTYLTVNKDIQVAGKTGTNENSRGIAFMGYTKYYTCGVWMGHDDFKPLYASGFDDARPFWITIMDSLHEGLESANIYDEVPDDVIEVTVCGVSGLLPNGEVCDHDQNGYGTTTEYFVKGTEPTQVCDMHKEVAYCTVSGKLAGKYCTEDEIEYKTAVILPEKSEYLKLIDSDYEYLLYEYFPLYFVNDVPYMDGASGEECYCDIHTEETEGLLAQKLEMMRKADALIRDINSKLKLSKYSMNISPAQTKQISDAGALLKELVNAPVFSLNPDTKVFNKEETEAAYNQLEAVSNEIFESIDAKLQLKSDFTTLGNRLIGQINIKLLRADYASVITVDEIVSINRDMDAFRDALDAPIYSSDSSVELFDEEIVRQCYNTLQFNSDTLFAALDERLKEPVDPDPDDEGKIISVFKDDETVDLDLELLSQYAVLIDASTGRILAQKNADVQMYPASMTKIMAVIVAYEYMRDNNIDMDSTYIMLTEDIISYIEEKNTASAGFEAGEVVCIKDLFYGAVMQSGADAVIMLARYCAGTENAFVTLMNSKAAALGLQDTNFTNCIGITDVNHYSTVNDMAVILAYANNYTFLRNVMEANTYTYKSTNKQAQRSVKSGLHSARIKYDMDIENSAVAGADNFGGKTGYTDEAGYCMMTFAYGANGKYIAVTADTALSKDAVSDYLYLYSNYSALSDSESIS